MAERTNIIKALVEVQKEIVNPKNSANNPFFKSKYAPLNEILDLVRPILSKNGLFLMQDTASIYDYETKADHLFIETIIYHTSGECIKSGRLYLKPDKNSVQGMGSAITYGRRYQLSAMLGITGEDDNDGNVEKPKQQQKPATKTVKKSVNKPKPKPPKKPSEEDIINDIVNKEVKKPKKTMPPKDY